MNDEKKVLGVQTLVVITLIIIMVGATYAFFKGTNATDEDTPLQVTTNTTDSLVFNVNTDIKMVADMSNFTEGKGNREGVANATATLKANNKTNSATDKYYLYFDIKENGLKYTTESKTAELLLQVTGPDGSLGDGDIANLNYVSVTDGKGQSISGFDITEVQDLITIASNKEITTTSEKVDNWEIKVVLVNLNEDQSSNGGKKFNGELLIQKEKYNFPLFADYIKTKVYTGIQGENNIYYHKNLENSAEDESYRYAGSYENVENYVCFGYDGSDACPWDNMYRIIGVFGSQVKLIKADYAKSSELGTSGDFAKNYNEYKSGYGPETNKGKNTQEEIGAYYWNKNNVNNWSDSQLNNSNLNQIYLERFDTTWQNKISMHEWKVGGNQVLIVRDVNAPTAYQNEIVTPAENTTESKKIGLMYVSDYMYGANSEYWTYKGNGTPCYQDITGYNWMYGGLFEWTITRDSSRNDSAFRFYGAGYTGRNTTIGEGAIRPCFYLTPEVTIIDGSGTQNDPFRID